MDIKEFKKYIIKYLIEKHNFIYKNNLLYKEYKDFFFVIDIIYSKFGYYKIFYNYSIKKLHNERVLIDYDVQIGRDLQSPDNVFNKEFLTKISYKDLNGILNKTFQIITLLEKKGIKYIYKYDKDIMFDKSREFLESVIKN